MADDSNQDQQGGARKKRPTTSQKIEFRPQKSAAEERLQLSRDPGKLIANQKPKPKPKPPKNDD